MRIKETKVYQFNELSDKAKEKAVENLADINIDYEWWEYTFEDALSAKLKLTEFDIGRGSYCKGEFIEYAEDTVKSIIENHGKTCETHKDAVNFQVEYNKQKTTHETDDSYDPEYMEYDETSEYHVLADEFLKSILEDYRIILQKEYEHLSSEEAIIETIEANEYEFTEDGQIS